MTDYEPIDIRTLCRTEPSQLGLEESFPGGEQTYHGLPFLIGDGQGNVLGFGSSIELEPVSFSIGCSVTHVIFAHRLIDSEIQKGGTPVGIACAEYVFRFRNGQPDVVVPIRERMEIGIIPTPWGQFPLLAKPDLKDELFPREEGKYEETGFRLMEADQKWPESFFIWYWKNPHPEIPLSEVVIRPLGPRFCIGGVTLSHLDEPPLVKSAKRPVRITSSNPEDAAREGNLEVRVDRGVTTYPYSLPSHTVDDFLKDDFKGWGESLNPKALPAYVEIAANPSATIEVRHQEKTLGKANWGEVEEKGEVETGPGLRIELIDPGRNWVRTTVVDDETGQPIPCRIHFRSPEGVPYAPHGHHPHVFSNMGTWHIDIGGDVRLGNITYAYIDGKCQGWLPRGDCIVDVAQGYEYEPLRTRVRIEPGQQELTLRLRRIGDMKRERYFAGDTHVHFLSTQGAHLEAAGEGLSVVNLLQSQWGHLFTNTEEFIGAPSVGNNGSTIVYAAQENRQHLLGHLTLLGLKEPVMPWCSDGPGEAEMGGNLEVCLSRWADACHAQGGTVIIPHLPTPNCEPATLIATGRADAVEFLVQGRYEHAEYYRYLNCGYKLPIVGGTDKMTSDVPVGIYRTYVYIPEGEEFTYDNWCKYLKAGNTFHSGGPLLSLRVENQPIGSTLRLPEGGGTVEVEASAVSVLPFHCLEVVKNGEVVDRVEDSAGTRSLSITSKIKVESHSWIAVRCGGAGYSAIPHHDGWKRGVMAHTSPVYIAVGEEWWMFSAETAQYMLTLIHGGLEYIRTRSPQWDPDRVTHHHSHENHIDYLEEPFRQALQVIHKRMHELGIEH